MLSLIGLPVCQSGSSGFLLVSSNLSAFRGGLCNETPKFDLGCEFLSGYSKLKVARSSKGRRSWSGSWFLLVWALDRQALEDEFLVKKSEEGFLEGGSESENYAVMHLDCRDNGDNVQENGKVDEKDGEEGDGEKGRDARVDVRAIARRLQLAKTADDVAKVMRDGGKFPLQVYSSIITAFGREKRLDCALAIVEWLKRKNSETCGRISPNLFIYNSLLGAVKQSEQYEVMDSVLIDMAQQEVVPNTVTYNTIMGIYEKQGRAHEALEVVDKMQKEGLVLSPVSYSTALLVYRRMEDANGALDYMVKLREVYRKGEIGRDDGEDWDKEFDKLENFTKRICYQVMRNMLVKEENSTTKVLKLLDDMDKAGLPLGRVEEERLVWACTRGEYYIVAKELYDRIRERQSGISLSVCNHVIWLMGKAKKWWAALEIYEDLLDRGPKPNNLSYELIVSHFNVLLTAARKRGIWRWGVKLLNKMEEKGLKTGSKEWNAVLVACSKAAETSAAVQIFRRMVERGEKPTILSYVALLSALEKGKLYDEARRVWDHMIKVGVEPNLYAYTTMASVFAGQGKFKMVDEIFKEMASSGIDPTVVTYNAIITACANNGMSSAAYEWFHRMKVRNISPNEVSYEMLIEALAKEGKPRISYELYVRAKTEGLDLSEKTYDAVIRSSRIYGASIDVSVLGPRPPDKKRNLRIRKSTEIL